MPECTFLPGKKSRQTKMDSLTYLITCPVCLDDFEETGSNIPRLLPCSHTVCGGCCELLLKKGSVTCPECRVVHTAKNGVQSFPQNRYILSSLRHPVVEPEPEIPVWSENLDKCQYHGRELSLFCKTAQCQMVICQVCMINNHKDHDVVDIAEEETKHGELYEELFEGLTSTSTLLEARTDELVKAKNEYTRNAEVLNRKISGKRDEIVKLINEMFESMLKETKDSAIEFDEWIHEKLEIIQANLTLVKSLKESVRPDDSAEAVKTYMELFLDVVEGIKQISPESRTQEFYQYKEYVNILQTVNQLCGTLVKKTTTVQLGEIGATPPVDEVAATGTTVTLNSPNTNPQQVQSEESVVINPQLRENGAQAAADVQQESDNSVEQGQQQNQTEDFLEMMVDLFSTMVQIEPNSAGASAGGNDSDTRESSPIVTSSNEASMGTEEAGNPVLPEESLGAAAATSDLEYIQSEDPLRDVRQSIRVTKEVKAKYNRIYCTCVVNNQIAVASRAKEFKITMYSITGSEVRTVKLTEEPKGITQAKLANVDCLAISFGNKKVIEFRSLLNLTEVHHVHSVAPNEPGILSAISESMLLYVCKNNSIHWLDCQTKPVKPASGINVMPSDNIWHMCCVKLGAAETAITTHIKNPFGSREGVFASERQSERVAWSVTEETSASPAGMNPRGVATDGSDRLFVCDSNNNCIHVFKLDGSYMGVVLKEGEHGIGKPWFVQWCEGLSSLVVGHIQDYNSNWKISVLKF